MIPDLSDTRIAAIEVTPMWAGTMLITDVDAALKNAGLVNELLPAAPTRGVCMRRAFDHCAPRGARIDGLPKGSGVAMSLKDVTQLDLEALAAQTGNVVREAASYHATLSVKILVVNANGSETETLTFSPADHPMVPLVVATYRAMREQYKASEDLSVWFSQTVIPAVGGVGKRSRGGVYYVPAHRKDTLVRIAEAFETLSVAEEVPRTVAGVSCPVQRLARGGKLCLEPRYAEDQAAMEILIDGVIRDTDSTIESLSDALTVEEGKRPLGKRALTTKRNEALKLEKEMKAWETMTSVSLDLLRNRLVEVQNALAQAELALDVEEASE